MQSSNGLDRCRVALIWGRGSRCSTASACDDVVPQVRRSASRITLLKNHTWLDGKYPMKKNIKENMARYLLWMGHFSLPPFVNGWWSYQLYGKKSTWQHQKLYSSIISIAHRHCWMGTSCDEPKLSGEKIGKSPWSTRQIIEVPTGLWWKSTAKCEWARTRCNCISLGQR